MLADLIRYFVWIVCIFTLFLSTELTHSSEYGTGLVFDDEAYKKIPKTANRLKRDYSHLPSRVSLKKYAPTPGDQGQYGTCVAWSAGYHARTIAESIRLDRTNRFSSNNNTFSPWHLYALSKKLAGNNFINCKKGMPVDWALKAMRDIGVVKYNNFLTSCITDLSQYADRQFKVKEAYQNRIYDFNRLHNHNSRNKILPVKKSLSENKPVVFGMMMPNSFMRAKGVWTPKPGDFQEAMNRRTGHAMMVVGYDNSKYGGAFEILNSWSEKWGNKGFIWIGYRNFQKFVKYSYEMIEQPDKVTNLRGELRFLGADGKLMKAHYKNSFKNSGLVYYLDQPYRSGKEFRLYINNQEPAWVYAFGMDSTEDVFRIFPHNNTISPYLGYSGNNVAIPDEDHYIRLDQTKGYDYFFFLYSNKKLDIEKIMAKIRSANHKNRFHQLMASLGKDAVDFRGVSFEKNKIAFSVSQVFESVIPIVVVFKHI